MKKRIFIPLASSLGILAGMMFSHSCANTTQAPSGGPKDTIPPTLIAVMPQPGELNVPLRPKVTFTFDEYVKIQDQKSIFLSPPLEKPLKAKIKGKSVVVTFEEDLLPNTTYTIDVTGAIVDNNEGNPFPGYALTFSTGSQIDSMYLTGVVMDCATLQPIKGATVMLYKDQADSAVFLHRPNAATITDEWGFYCLRNIQDTVFRLYAVMDENGNNMYDSETEKVAFCDSLIRPEKKIADGIYELYKFNMKDTLACLKRHSDYDLYMFLGKNSKQALKNSGRIGERCLYLSFLAPDADILKMSVKGYKKKHLISQMLGDRDSLLVWINDQRVLADTLYMNLDYMKTDSTGVLVKTAEKLKMVKDRKVALAAKKSSRKDLKHEDTIAVFKIEQAPEMFEQCGIKVIFANPLIRHSFDKIKYEITNPRQQTSTGTYTWEQDSTDLRNYIIRPKGKLQTGYEYKFTIPERGFRDVDGHYNDSSVVSIKLPEDDKLSTLTLKMTEVHTRYAVDLMTEKRDKVIRSYSITGDTDLRFPYLNEGTYCIRVTEDRNNNGKVDTGDLLSHKQSEKVRFFKLPKSDMTLRVPASSEIEQSINLKEMFK